MCTLSHPRELPCRPLRPDNSDSKGMPPVGVQPCTRSALCCWWWWGSHCTSESPTDCTAPLGSQPRDVCPVLPGPPLRRPSHVWPVRVGSFPMAPGCAWSATRVRILELGRRPAPHVPLALQALPALVASAARTAHFVALGDLALGPQQTARLAPQDCFQLGTAALGALRALREQSLARGQEWRAPLPAISAPLVKARQGKAVTCVQLVPPAGSVVSETAPATCALAARRRHQGPPPQQPAPVVEWGPLHLLEAFVSFVCRGTSVASATRLRASPVLRAPGQVAGLETLAPRHAPRAQTEAMPGQPQMCATTQSQGTALSRIHLRPPPLCAPWGDTHQLAMLARAPTVDLAGPQMPMAWVA